MFEKLLAVAGMTAVAGFGLALTVGGCSSSDPAAPVASTDAGTNTPDAKVRTPPPAGDVDEPDDSCGPDGDPLTIAALDAEIGWKPPAARQNACTAGDLAKIKEVLDSNLAKSYLDFIADTSTSCQACAKSTKDAATWAPIVVKDAADTIGTANFGACYAAADNPSCGKARQYLEICIKTACSRCTVAADLQECAQSAAQDQCNEVFTSAQASCKDAQADAKCGDLLVGIQYLCAYEDADAGAPDGG